MDEQPDFGDVVTQKDTKDTPQYDLAGSELFRRLEHCFDPSDTDKAMDQSYEALKGLVMMEHLIYTINRGEKLEASREFEILDFLYTQARTLLDLRASEQLQLRNSLRARTGCVPYANNTAGLLQDVPAKD